MKYIMSNRPWKAIEKIVQVFFFSPLRVAADADTARSRHGSMMKVKPRKLTRAVAPGAAGTAAHPRAPSRAGLSPACRSSRSCAGYRS